MVSVFAEWQNILVALNPIAFKLGFFVVNWYAVFFLAGFFVTLGLALWQARRGEAPYGQEQIFDLFIYLFLGACLGGRAGYVIFYNPQIFWADPAKIFLPYDFGRGIWTGISGMSYYGGLAGIALALYVFARAHRKSFWETADFLALLAPIAIFLGRLGNFFNLELYGRITGYPWGMIFPGVPPLGTLRHPSALYEAVLEGVVIFILLFFLRKRMPFKGALTSIYFVSYAVLRFFGEFFREPDPQLGLFYSTFTLNQILAGGMFLVGLAIFQWLRSQNYATMKISSSA